MLEMTKRLLKAFPEDRRPGGSPRYFVEAGAHNGILYPHGGSATYELEKAGWQGLCIEPSTYYEQLVKCRFCLTDGRALGPTDGETLTFRQVAHNHVELSGLVDYFTQDRHAESRMIGTDRQVTTVRLSTILTQYKFPKQIEFLCLDTEGSELAILKGHDWNAHYFGVIFVEHNGVSQRRDDLLAYLESKGYRKAKDNWDNGQDLTMCLPGVDL